MSNLTAQLFPAFNQDILTDLLRCPSRKPGGSPASWRWLVHDAVRWRHPRGDGVHFPFGRAAAVPQGQGAERGSGLWACCWRFGGGGVGKTFLAVHPVAPHLPGGFGARLGGGGAVRRFSWRWLGFFYAAFAPVRLRRGQLLAGTLVAACCGSRSPAVRWFLRVIPDYG
jgi:hypothetical protein